MVGQAGVGSHRPDRGEVDRDRIAGRAGARGVAWPVAPSTPELVEPEVMGDLGLSGVEHVGVAVPHLAAAGAFPFVDDLGERGQRRIEAVDRDHASGAALEMRVPHLPGRVAGEYGRFAESFAEILQASLDGGVELTDRLVAVSFGPSLGGSRPLDAEERVERVGSERRK